MNDKAKVSPTLKKTIKETAAKMGYERNTYASRLSQKPITIGIIINGYDKNYYQYTLKALACAEDALRDSKVNLDIHLLEIDDNTEEKSLQLIQAFIHNKVDGVILNDVNSKKLNDAAVELANNHIPLALLNYNVPDLNKTFAMVNDYACATGLACELLAMNLKYRKTKTVVMYSQSPESSCGQELRSHFLENALKNNITEIIMVRSDRELFDLLEKREVAGIYISMASYLGACGHIEEHFTADDKPFLIVSDLYDAAVPYIENGTIDALIYQEPEQQAYDTVMTLYKVIFEHITPANTLRIRPILLLKSNYKNYLHMK